MPEPTVLVVDDDPIIVEMLTVALEDRGYRVLTSVNGAALQLAQDERPGLILLDLMMPGMDGMEVSQHLRADPTTAAIPIVAMSAQHTLSAAGTRMLSDDRLPKPFDLHTLYATVARWVPS